MSKQMNRWYYVIFIYLASRKRHAMLANKQTSEAKEGDKLGCNRYSLSSSFKLILNAAKPE
jgi:hypothetical protein